MIKKFKIVALIISVLLFVMSLTQPAFYIDRSDPDGWSNSFGLLFIGWFGALSGSGAAMSWLANPFIIISWFVLFKRTRLALVLSFLATLFSLLFLFFHTVISGEDGAYSVISARKAGYWLWLSSITIFFFISFIIDFFERKPERLYPVNSEGLNEIKKRRY